MARYICRASCDIQANTSVMSAVGSAVVAGPSAWSAARVAGSLEVAGNAIPSAMAAQASFLVINTSWFETVHWLRNSYGPGVSIGCPAGTIHDLGPIRSGPGPRSDGRCARVRQRYGRRMVKP